MNPHSFTISWASPEYLFFLLLVPTALLLLWYRLYRLRGVISDIAGKWPVLLIRNFSLGKSIVKILLMTVGILFLVLALLRPQWNKKEELVQQEGRNLFIALDVSRSMLAADCSPNRLQYAKTKIKRLLQLLKCERVGLILFSGSAFVQCPLTADYDALYMFLDQVDVETISSGTTALDAALAKALETFETMMDQKNKLLMIFTDGEDFSSNLIEFKREARHAGLHIFTFGLGTTQGAPIPLFNEHGEKIGHQLDAAGNVVISRLNEGILNSLAQEVGGVYVQMKNDDSDLQQLIEQISRFEKERFEDKKVSQLEDQYPYFLLVALFCFAIEWLL